MTKKHFEWAAAWLRQRRALGAMPERDRQLDQIEEFAVELFLEFGENFDPARFREVANK